MSTRVVATARLNRACRDELREQLSLSVDPVSELSRLNSVIACRQLTRPDLQRLISAPGASSVLGGLAPAEFSRIRAHTAAGSRSALEITAADLQAELAEAVAAAVTAVTAATRDITANIFAESGAELGYTAATHQVRTTTCVELCRGHEIVLVAVHDGGNVEFAHGGLSCDVRGERQLQLERAARRHGVFVTPRS